jgi:hypothetical protein
MHLFLLNWLWLELQVVFQWISSWICILLPWFLVHHFFCNKSKIRKESKFFLTHNFLWVISLSNQLLFLWNLMAVKYNKWNTWYGIFILSLLKKHMYICIIQCLAKFLKKNSYLESIHDFNFDAFISFELIMIRASGSIPVDFLHQFWFSS